MAFAQTKAMLGVLPFNLHLGLEIREEAGKSVVWMPDTAPLKNHIGTQHAGALFTLGEAASGAAVLDAFVDLLASATPLAKTATIEYKKVARGPILARGALAEPADAIRARVEAEGKTVFDVNVVLSDEAGVEVVTMRVSWHLRKNA